MPTKAHATDAKISFLKNSENGRWKICYFFTQRSKRDIIQQKKTIYSAK